MRIWVDADACPRAVKEILFRAGSRRRVTVTLVANRTLRVPPSPYVRAVQVPSGFDRADQWIVGEVQPGDLVVTADIPLAAQALERGGHALDPRGDPFTPDAIGERLAMRGFLDELRGSGVATGGPPPLSAADIRAFANGLDRFLARHEKA